MGRILSIDYGERRIGLAVSDELKITAQGINTLDTRKNKDIFQYLSDLLLKYDVETIVIGMPYELNGSKGAKAQDVDNFISELKKITNIPIETFDERFTTMEAKKTLLTMGIKQKKNKGKIDELSAIFLLQSYLQKLETDLTHLHKKD